MAGVDDIDVAWIWKIWVDEKYRHQGLGTRLIKHFEKKAKEKDATPHEANKKPAIERRLG